MSEFPPLLARDFSLRQSFQDPDSSQENAFATELKESSDLPNDTEDDNTNDIRRDFFLRRSFQNHAIIDPETGELAAFSNYDWQWDAETRFTTSTLNSSFSLQDDPVKDGVDTTLANLNLLFDENFSESLGFNENHNTLRRHIIFEAALIALERAAGAPITYQNILEEIPGIIERYDKEGDGDPGSNNLGGVRYDDLSTLLGVPENPGLGTISPAQRDHFLRDVFSENKQGMGFSEIDFVWPQDNVLSGSLHNANIPLGSLFSPDPNNLGILAGNKLSLIRLIESNFHIDQYITDNFEYVTKDQIAEEAEYIARSRKPEGQENTVTFQEILEEVPNILERYDNNQIDGDYGDIRYDTTMNSFLNGFLRNLPLFLTTG